MVLKELQRPFFVLAPMDDITDTVFRQMVAQLAPPDLCFTEFVNVDGLQSPGRAKLLHKLRFSEAEQPIIGQIWGKNPDNYAKTASELVEMGYDGVDINMGCPDRTIVKNGSCAALINDRELALRIIEACKAGVAGRVPLSVKTRIGFNTIDLGWIELLLEQGLDMLTIHARTKKEMSLVPAHWDVFADIIALRDRIAPDTLIVGNGDIMNHAHGLEIAKKYNLDGVMIGRGLFHDPFAFAEQSPWADFSAGQKIDLYARHIRLFEQTWKNNERRIVTLNKFCKTYIHGFENAGELRAKLMDTRTSTGLLEILGSYVPAA